MSDTSIDIEMCLRYIPKNKEELKLITAVFEIMNQDIYVDIDNPVIFWLVDTKCVWVVPINSFIYRKIIRDYPNQKAATFTQVKEVALSLILGINDYY